jgi:hypothetical protein
VRLVATGETGREIEVEELGDAPGGGAQLTTAGGGA